MAANFLNRLPNNVITGSSLRGHDRFSNWAREGPQSRVVGVAKTTQKPFERDKLRSCSSRMNCIQANESSFLQCPRHSSRFSKKPSSSLGALLKGRSPFTFGFLSKDGCVKRQARRRGRIDAAAAEKARPGRPAYPKTQTGVTLKWVGPSRKKKCSTETVLRSNCVDKKADEQKVECKIETVAWRKRHISASIEVGASLEQVWRVLTDYEQLADFIPNLARSERIACPNPGRIWLLQLGVQSSMYWQIEARVVLDLEERSDAPEGPELHFSMVEGDFKLFAGKWCLRNSARPGHVTLHYEVDVLPRAILPTAFVEKIIQADLPRNLRAIADRAQALMTSVSEPEVTSSSSEDSSTALPPSLVTVATGAGAGLDLEVSWWSGPGQPPNPASIEPQANGSSSDVTTSSRSLGRRKTAHLSLEANASVINGSSKSLGEESSTEGRNKSDRANNSHVMMPGESIELPKTGRKSWKESTRGALSDTPDSETAPAEAQSRGEQEPGSKAESSTASSDDGSRASTRGPSVERGPWKEPRFELTDAPYFPAECPVIPPENRAVRAQLRHRVDEVHLRRMDDLLENGGVHRRVVAAITIAAPPESIWEVLTDYEALKEFIPNLAKSEVQSRCPEENRVRLHQVGVKCLCYMVLHAQATMDIVENPYKEIAFKQIDGDFEAFEGRWILEPLGPVHTMLKYVVETRVRKNSLLPEALVEEVIYEDLPANLCAIRKRVESNKSIYSDPSFLSRGEDPPGTSGSSGGGRSWGNSTPRLGLDVAQVSETAHRRKTLRKLPVHSTGTYLDGEKATVNMLSRTRNEKPKPCQTPRPRTASPSTYSDFSALESALRAFISDRGVCGHMPTRAQLRGAGRVDLEKGMRLHGGPSSVATKLGLKVQKQQKPARYWCDIGNMEREIRAFQSATGLDPQVMPTRRQLEKAGRFDIARALEKWGGAKALANALKLTIVERRKVA